MHQFEVQTYLSPQHCAFCSRLLVGVARQGFQCSHCKLDVHEGCIEGAKTKFTCLNQGSLNDFNVAGDSPSRTNHQTSQGGDGSRENVFAPVTHSFSTKTFTKPTYCILCGKILIGVYQQGMSCSFCDGAVHSGDCASKAMSQTTCTPKQRDQSGKGMSFSTASLQSALQKATTRLVGSSSGSEEVPQISGPTNVQHVAGLTTGRTLVSIEQAQKDARHKMDPVTSKTNGSVQLQPPPPPPPPTSMRPPAPLPDSTLANGRAHTPEAPSRHAPPPPPRPPSLGVARTLDSSGPSPLLKWNPNQIFGTPLENQPSVTLIGYRCPIPTMLVLLGRDLREREGFKAEGLFRIAPSRVEQSDLRKRLSESPSESSTVQALEMCRDPHVIAALIKEWCRLLPSTILSELDSDSIRMLSEENFETGQPSADFLGLYHEMLLGSKFVSEKFRAVFLWLLDLMSLPTHFADSRMSFRAVGTCFAPSLFYTSISSPEVVQQIKLVTNIIVNALLFVSRYDPSSPRDVFGDKCPSILSISKPSLSLQ